MACIETAVNKTLAPMGYKIEKIVVIRGEVILHIKQTNDDRLNPNDNKTNESTTNSSV